MTERGRRGWRNRDEHEYRGSSDPSHQQRQSWRDRYPEERHGGQPGNTASDWQSHRGRGWQGNQDWRDDEPRGAKYRGDFGPEARGRGEVNRSPSDYDSGGYGASRASGSDQYTGPSFGSGPDERVERGGSYGYGPPYGVGDINSDRAGRGDWRDTDWQTHRPGAAAPAAARAWRPTVDERSVDMNLKNLLLDELKDLYDAEQQLAKALPQLAAAAQSDGLRSAFESHLEETRNHARRLEDVFTLLGVKAAGKHCDGIAGIVKEANKSIAQPGLDGAVKDAALIAGAQKAEHYEMAGYGTVSAWARTLGLTEIANSLDQTLDEEKAADQALNDLAEQEVNLSAAHEARRAV